MKTLVAILLLLCTSVYAATPTVVNTDQNDNGGSSVTATSTGGFTTTTGNLLVVCSGAAPTSVTMTITDLAGGTFVPLTAQARPDNGYAIQCFYDKNITGRVSDSVTVHSSASATFLCLVVLEINGASTTAPLDVSTAINNSGNSTNATSSTFTTTRTNEILIIAGQASGQVMSAGTGYTVRTSTSPTNLTIETKGVSAIQTGVTGGFTNSSTNWAVVGGTFADVGPTSASVKRHNAGMIMR